MTLRTRPSRMRAGEAEVAVARVVVDDGQLAGSTLDERVDELDGLTRRSEPADHDRCAVTDTGDRLGGRGDDVDHQRCSLERSQAGSAEGWAASGSTSIVMYGNSGRFHRIWCSSSLSATSKTLRFE